MVNRWKDLWVSRRIASRPVEYELPGWFLLTIQGLAEKPFGRSTTSHPSHQNIDHVTILIHRSPEVVELPEDLDEDLIHMSDVAQPTLPTAQVPSEGGTEFAAPQSARFVGDCDATLGEKVFDIPEAEGGPMIEPPSVTVDLKWEAVTSIQRFHRSSVSHERQLDKTPRCPLAMMVSPSQSPTR